MIFTKSTREELNLDLKIYGDNLKRQDEIKFLGIRFDSRLTFSPLIDELKERCNSRLNLIEILSNKNWRLHHRTLRNLYKSLIGSILDYNFPCLNSLSDTNIKKLQTIQNSAVRSILKLRFDTPASILYHEAQNKLKFHTISNRLFELSERYVRAGLTNSVPLLLRL
ncbi:RNA-directed DNA polymerase from mobile element jockey-like, partial [Brachionus plicatilis]